MKTPRPILALVGVTAILIGTAIAAPTIVTGPQTQVAAVGASVTLFVEATGVPPLTYQWMSAPVGKQLVDIPGATDSELLVESVTEGMWLHQVAVTDAEGTTLSAIARLVGQSPPILATEAFDLTLAAGEDITLRVRLADGAPPIRYQWRFEGSTLEGETKSTLTLTNVQTIHAGEYAVEVSNNVGWATGVVARLRLGTPAFTLVQDDPVVTPAANSSPGKWADYDNDGFLDLFVANDEGQKDFLYHNEGNGNAWLLVRLIGTASNRSAIGAWVEVTTVIAGQEVTQTRHVDNGAYGGQGDSRLHFGLGDATKVNRLRIEWPSGTVQELTDVQARQILEVTEVLSLSEQIEQHPQSITVAEGQPAKLFAKVSGPAPLSFQWYRNGKEIPGATNRILHFPSVRSEDAGTYHLVVSDGIDEGERSSEAVLAVNPPHQPGPHEFTGVWFDGELGTLWVTLTGQVPPGFLDIFALDTSEDLKTWQALPPVASDTGAMSWDVIKGPHRFFRGLGDGFWTPYPAPNGPYAVGTFQRQVSNSTGTITLMATVWYPARLDVNKAPAPWFHSAYVEYLAERFGPGMKVLDHLYGHSIPGLAVAEAQPTWPVVMLSHAYRGHGADNRDLAETLASHGYIVVSANHRDAEFTVLEDGTEVRGSGLLCYDFAMLNIRVTECRLLLDSLTQWNDADPMLEQRMDLEAIGAVGFSLGGEALAELGRIDPRLRAVAVVGLEPFWCYGLAPSGVARPLLLVVEEPMEELAPSTDSIYNQAYRLFSVSPGPAYYLRVGGTMHHSLTGVMRIVAPQVPGGSTDNRRAAAILNAAMVSFFNKHLLGQDDHLLDDAQSAIPELAAFMTK